MKGLWKGLCILGVLTLMAASCAAADLPETAETQSSEIKSPNFTYFRLRPDFRKCVSPLCGGFFVKRVNRKTTICTDGSQQPECYVAELDLSTLGLSEAQVAELRGDPQEFLLKGNVVPKIYPNFGNLGEFKAEEAWRGHADVVASGTYYRVKDHEIVCITHPCFSLTSEKLNRRVLPRSITGVDLSGITPDSSDGEAQLKQPEGLLLSGSYVEERIGSAPALDASEYYLPFSQLPQACGASLPACQRDEFCAFPPGDCGLFGRGVCTSKPHFCTEQYDPVCGCDGRTYSNACFATAAGVNIRLDGECKTQVCGGLLGLPCDKGEFCDFGYGTCQIADSTGICKPQPEACTTIYDPVCGCDGLTYGNECVANMKGARLNRPGECK